MRKARPVEERFWEKVAIDAPDCWPWLAHVSGAGYGQFRLSTPVTVFAHRFAWELSRGPIPDGLTVDHLCRNTTCCNPGHMELVTAGENSQRMWEHTPRAETCRRGHPRVPEDTYVGASGRPECKPCRNDAVARYRKRRRGADSPFVKVDSHWTRRVEGRSSDVSQEVS